MPEMQQEKQQEPQVRFLGREDSLGKEMGTYSNTLAWKIPRTVHGVTEK